MAQQVQGKKRKPLPLGFWIAITIVIILIIVLAITSAWILTHQGITQGTATLTIVSIIGGLILALIAALFTYLQWRYPIPTDTAESVSPSPAPQVSSPTPIIIQLQQPTPPQPPSPPIPQPPITDKPISGNITGSFPPTDPKTIQQRQKLVEQVYTELTKPDINCLVLTGIGGIGKSTLAALVYNYAEEQRKAGKGPFTAEALWITVEEATATFAYLAETISEVLGKPIPDVAKLPPQNQAAALFKMLNTLDHPCLIVINQFENLLDSQTGQASDPGLGEWLDILNSRPCRCRVLLTGRPMPQGTHDYPPTHIQEYPIEGLETNEGVDLLRKQGVQTTQATDGELRTAVAHCDGHALSLELLASILRRNQSLSLHSLFNNPIYAQLWTGDIARRLLDYIYEQQLNDVQRQVLQAFSVYREPVPLEAVQTVVDGAIRTSSMQASASLLDALNVLLAQHLLQDVGKECYQLHAVLAEYAQRHFDEHDEQINKQALQAAHAKAAQYYLQRAMSCPPREKRRKVDDVQPLIEAFWQYCQAGQWQEAYNLMLEEGLFDDLRRWSRDAILLELCQILLPSKEWQPERPQVARIYNELGLVYDALDKKQEALSYYEQALVISREVGDRCGEGKTLNNLGGVYDALGKKQEALAYYEQALVISREVGDRGGEGTTLNNIGILYLEQARYDVALASSLLARDIFEEVQSPNRDGVQSWIDGLREKIGDEQFTTLLAQVEPQASQVVEQALRGGL